MSEPHMTAPCPTCGATDYEVLSPCSDAWHAPQRPPVRIEADPDLMYETSTGYLPWPIALLLIAVVISFVAWEVLGG